MIALGILKFFTLFAILLMACVTDFTHYKIYNGLIIFGLICGLGLSFLDQAFSGILISMTAIFVALILFIPLYLCRGMAAGDVKLCMVVASFLNIHQWLSTAIMIYLLGGALALVTVLCRRKLGQLFSNMNALILLKLHKADIQLSHDNQSTGLKSVGRMPFALAITAGTLLAYYRSGTLPFHT